ncbi:hypothetical protein AMELA_G00033200 [Ameiurus melas]|uniref:Uncharacterized protein n=1 Tax=Ameiurus melas TaxID=219545 RepID=A0A7J6B7V4_AMEME|nr:hypothetical protein AMELA_G00033200 [Ameiurus melas]
MALQCFVFLVIFLSKCFGHTEFIYTAKDEVKLFCDTYKWQISTESNNSIDVNCTVESVHAPILYVTIPILLALATVTVWFIWKKIKTSPGSQAIELQRNQNADDMEEKADMECPYAVGSGEEEIKFRSQGDALKQEGQEESRDLYSVVKLNDLYEPGV